MIEAMIHRRRSSALNDLTARFEEGPYREATLPRQDLSKTALHVEYEPSRPMREPLVALLDHLAEWSKLHDPAG
jgi:hypothetical protein